MTWKTSATPSATGFKKFLTLRHGIPSHDTVKYVVSAWAESNGLVLGQMKVADKSNEITVVPELLRVLELTGCIVTVDAMGYQK